MGVHDVQWHLDRVETEMVLVGDFEHAQMTSDLVAGETDEADFARFLGCQAASIPPPGAKMRSGLPGG